MRSSWWIAAAMLAMPLSLLHGQTASDLSEGLTIAQMEAGSFEVAWWGRGGWTYFIQESEDLVHWHYVPVIEPGGDEGVQWGFSSNAERLFFRLRMTDEPTADPDSADFDGDGLSNAEELAMGLDPLNLHSQNDGTNDGDRDYDVDGLTNVEEKGSGKNLFWKDHPAVVLEAGEVLLP